MLATIAMGAGLAVASGSCFYEGRPILACAFIMWGIGNFLAYYGG